MCQETVFIRFCGPVAWALSCKSIHSSSFLHSPRKNGKSWEETATAAWQSMMNCRRDTLSCPKIYIFAEMQCVGREQQLKFYVIMDEKQNYFCFWLSLSRSSLLFCLPVQIFCSKRYSRTIAIRRIYIFHGDPLCYLGHSYFITAGKVRLDASPRLVTWLYVRSTLHIAQSPSKETSFTTSVQNFSWKRPAYWGDIGGLRALRDSIGKVSSLLNIYSKRTSVKAKSHYTVF